MKPLQYAVAAAVVVALGSGACLGLGAGAAAPVVSYRLLNGTKASTEQFRGKVVFINFRGTACTTCVREVPEIVATYDKYKTHGFGTLAVAMSYDPTACAVDFAETRKLPFGMAIDNTGAIARSFGNVRLTPNSVLINKRGEIVKRYVDEPDFTALRKLLEQLLAET